MSFSSWCKSGKTTLQLSVFSSVAQVNPEHWNRVAGPENIFLSLPYLRALEEGMSAVAGFRYLVFYHPTSGPAGIAVVQMLRFMGNNFKQREQLCFMGRTIKDRLIDPDGVRVLVCGNAYATGENGFAFTGEIDQEEMIQHLSSALEQLQKEERSSFDTSFTLLKEFWPTSTSPVFGDQRFRSFKIDVNMVMTLLPGWKTREDYLQSLTAKFRTKANSVYKRSESLRIEELGTAGISRHLDKIAVLYNAVYDRAQFKFMELSGLSLLKFKEYLGNDFIFMGYFYGEELVGFSAAFVFGDILDANLVGLSYEHNRELALYQRMLYDFTELAIRRGCKELRLGRTAEEIKSCIGARPVDMTLYIRHKNKVSNTLIKPIVESVAPSPFELRFPFKAHLA
jgi:hypothetical protein